MTKNQRHFLIKEYVEHLVENMDRGELIFYAKDNLLSTLDAYDNDELVDEVSEEAPELLTDALYQDLGASE